MTASKIVAAAASGVGGAGLDVDEVFNTTIYTGTNSATIAVNNGIDLSGEGGMVWLKGRDVGSAYSYGDHEVFDSINQSSTAKYLRPVSSEALANNGTLANNGFSSTGFTLKQGAQVNNRNGDSSVAHTYRKAEKFFDMVQYTGNGSAQTISHNLGCAVGMMMVKRTDSAGAWRVFHRSLGATKALTLSAGAAADATSSTYWNDTAPTSTQFTIGTDLSDNGGTYTAYIWAHNDGDGGFGPDADQDIIKCGTYTGNGGDGNFINLGFEPQWLMLKKYNASQNAFFYVMDAMRGVSSEADSEVMYWNAVAATFGSQMLEFNPNGFTLTDGANSFNGNGDGYVYMAIRRGPLNTPDTASKVFNTGAVQNNTNRNIANALTGQQSPDMAIWKNTGAGQKLVFTNSITYSKNSNP